MSVDSRIRVSMIIIHQAMLRICRTFTRKNKYCVELSRVVWLIETRIKESNI